MLFIYYTTHIRVYIDNSCVCAIEQLQPKGKRKRKQIEKQPISRPTISLYSTPSLWNFMQSICILNDSKRVKWQMGYTAGCGTQINQ